MSARTVNPEKYSTNANLLLLGTDREIKKLERSQSKNIELHESITGCSKAVNPECRNS